MSATLATTGLTTYAAAQQGATGSQKAVTDYQPKNDPRFRGGRGDLLLYGDLSERLDCFVQFGLYGSSLAVLRLEGDKSWVEMSPAFAYTGLKLQVRALEDGMDTTFEPTIEAADQFAAEMDHMALCVQQNLQPHTGGEEGLQDQRIVEAIYESAKTGKPVKLALPAGTTRGPDPKEA